MGNDTFLIIFPYTKLFVRNRAKARVKKYFNFYLLSKIQIFNGLFWGLSLLVKMRKFKNQRTINVEPPNITGCPIW